MKNVYFQSLMLLSVSSVLTLGSMFVLWSLSRGKHHSMGITLTFTKWKQFVLTRKILSEQFLFSLKPTPLSCVLLCLVLFFKRFGLFQARLCLSLDGRGLESYFSFLEVGQARIWSQKFNYMSVKSFLVSDDFKVGNASFASSVNLALFCGASVATAQSQRDFGQVTFLARE